MKSSNEDAIKHSFTLQSKNFEAGKLNFTEKKFLDFIVTNIHPQKTDTVLEVAAGTCVCGCSLAPLVQNVTCLDMTSAMLMAGKETAGKQALENMAFVIGDAEELPFLNDSFDIVISRLAFHHFPDIDRSFDEMVRVLRPHGKLVFIDMEAAEDKLRLVRDEIETMRDPSHIQNLSKEEMLKLYSKHSIQVDKCTATDMPILLNDWIDFTETPITVKQKLIERFENEVNGMEKTGFYPYQTDKGISFNQKWIFILGTKPQNNTYE